MNNRSDIKNGVLDTVIAYEEACYKRDSHSDLVAAGWVYKEEEMYRGSEYTRVRVFKGISDVI